MEQQKTCTRCKQSKPFNCFYVNRSSSNFQSYCKDCDSERKRSKATCICGKNYTITHYQRHLRSSLHHRWLEKRL